MRYQYYYCKWPDPKLIGFLDRNEIKYKLLFYGEEPRLVYFSLWSSSPNAEKYIEEIKNSFGYTPIIYKEFSPKDYATAKFLVIRPKSQTIEIINYASSFGASCRWVNSYGEECAGHQYPIGTLAIAKEPSIKGGTAMWSYDIGFGVIFADYRIRDMAVKSGLSGIEFENVLKKNGTVSDILYHMTTQYVIPRETISLGHGEKILKCPICGKEQYCVDTEYQLHLDCSKIEAKSDFYVTDRIWGAGMAEPKHIISQRFYRLLKENSLAKGVVFEPVVDISE